MYWWNIFGKDIVIKASNKWKVTAISQQQRAVMDACLHRCEINFTDIIEIVHIVIPKFDTKVSNTSQP